MNTNKAEMSDSSSFGFIRGPVLILAAALLVGPAVAADSTRANALCGQATGIASELATISGMKLHHPVPCDLITKDKVNEFLKKRVKESTTSEEIRAEELTLKKFGFVPQDFN